MRLQIIHREFIDALISRSEPIAGLTNFTIFFNNFLFLLVPAAVDILPLYFFQVLPSKLLSIYIE